MERRAVAGVSKLFSRGDGWEETVLSWQQQIDAVFGRADRRRPARRAARLQSSPEADSDRPEPPGRPRS